jgi:hypothetical protein
MVVRNNSKSKLFPQKNLQVERLGRRELGNQTPLFSFLDEIVSVMMGKMLNYFHSIVRRNPQFL